MKTLLTIQRFLVFCLAALTTMAFTACPANKGTRMSILQEETRTFSLSNFDRLDLGSAFVITVTQGSNYKITASGRQSDLEDLDASIGNNKTLRIRYKNNSFGNNRHERVTLTITMPNLSGVSFSGASKSTVTGFRNMGDFTADISGASSSTIDVDASQVSIDISGASNATLKGKAKTLNGEVSGAASLKAFDLKLESATVEASGASKAQVFATSRLQADASGASSVNYKGSPSVQSHTSGASSVRSAN
ncbi:head GIN domain-containing protein [Tellurirhabdus bombi]|uniref:head GIN domain-containing protein n=1 Tax=Tellurirhabdus bombi TaxID=2907205 RepID=UPI001F21CED3|nr:head GIN domain-containing protein [Tellurirhabdus bombi]